MYIEQGFASPPPPVDEEPPFDRLDEEPRYPFTRLQKIGMRFTATIFGLEGVTCIGDGEYVGGGIIIAMGIGMVAISKWGEWRDANTARIPDIVTGDFRDKYGQPVDNRGEVW